MYQYQYACEILLKKERENVEPDEPPDKNYVTHLALTALCSAHRKKADSLTPNYLIPSLTIRLHALWKTNEADELTKLAREYKRISIIGNKACCNCGKLNEYERYFVFKEDFVDYEQFESIGNVRQRVCGFPSGEIKEQEKTLGGWDYNPTVGKFIKKIAFHIQFWEYEYEQNEKIVLIISKY